MELEEVEDWHREGVSCVYHIWPLELQAHGRETERARETRQQDDAQLQPEETRMGVGQGRQRLLDMSLVRAQDACRCPAVVPFVNSMHAQQSCGREE